MSKKQQEGELYKKLFPFADKVEAEYGTCLGSDTATVELEKILNEAKAEAPNEKDEKYRDYYPDKIHYHFKYDEFINDFNRWFMKWFGAPMLR